MSLENFSCFHNDIDDLDKEYIDESFEEITLAQFKEDLKQFDGFYTGFNDATGLLDITCSFDRCVVSCHGYTDIHLMNDNLRLSLRSVCKIEREKIDYDTRDYIITCDNLLDKPKPKKRTRTEYLIHCIFRKSDAK